MYYLGIDGGGNYSRLVAADLEDKAIGRHAGNSTNLYALSPDKVKLNLHRLIYEFQKLTKARLENCMAVCLGSACVNTEEMRKELERILREIGFTCPLKVVNSAELLIATEAKEKPGLVIVSGMSAFGYAIDKNGKPHKVAGLGCVLDDGGSSYRMGLDAIKYTIMAHDGRRPHTGLCDRVTAHFGAADIYELAGNINSGKYSKLKIAELSVDIKTTSTEGDTSAKEIEANAVRELVFMVRALILRHGLNEHKVVLSGNTFTLNDNIRNALMKQVKEEFPRAEVIPQREKAEIGALNLAFALNKAKHP